MGPLHGDELLTDSNLEVSGEGVKCLVRIFLHNYGRLLIERGVNILEDAVSKGYCLRGAITREASDRANTVLSKQLK